GRRGPLRGNARRADGSRGVLGGGATMSGIDWKRPLEDVLGDDATARRQLAEHAQLLPIADARTSLRFVLARLREHWVASLAPLVVTIGGAVAAAILPRLIGSAVDVVAEEGSSAPGWRPGAPVRTIGVVQAAPRAVGRRGIASLG